MICGLLLQTQKSLELPACHTCSESEHRHSGVASREAFMVLSSAMGRRRSCHLLPSLLGASCAPSLSHPPGGYGTVYSAATGKHCSEQMERLLGARGREYACPFTLSASRWRKLYKKILGRSTLGIPERKRLGSLGRSRHRGEHTGPLGYV